MNKESDLVNDIQRNLVILLLKVDIAFKEGKKNLLVEGTNIISVRKKEHILYFSLVRLEVSLKEKRFLIVCNNVLGQNSFFFFINFVSYTRCFLLRLFLHLMTIFHDELWVWYQYS